MLKRAGSKYLSLYLICTFLIIIRILEIVLRLDLSKLLGGQGFNVDSQLAYNGLSFPVTTLADTRANRYLFIDMKKAIELAHFYNIPTEPLKQPAKTRGFSGSAGPQITHTIKLHLIIGRQ